MKWSILIVFLIMNEILCGQRDSLIDGKFIITIPVSYPSDSVKTEFLKKPLDNKFWINTAPLSLIDVFGGNSYRIGIEYKLYKNITNSIEFGKYFNYAKTGFLYLLKINSQGYIVRASLKYYLNKNKLAVGNYLSIEYLYKNITFDYIDSILIKPNPTYAKQYTIHKEISAVTVKYGLVKIYKSRFVIDLYAGVGVRYFSKGYFTLTPEEEEGLLAGENHGDWVGAGQRATGDFWIPNVNAGIKIGFRIK